jgi:hypothetical protein
MRRLICLALVCVVALQLPACATRQDGDPSRAEQGAITGALAGGILGALAGGDRRNVLVGALAGAAVGAAIGGYQDTQIAGRTEAAKRYALDKQPRLEVETSINKPFRARPGATVESQVSYTLLAPSTTQDLKVNESRTLVSGKETFPLSKRDVTRPQGTHLSTLKFTLPAGLVAGDYTLITTVTSGTLTRTARSPLRVI